MPTWQMIVFLPVAVVGWLFFGFVLAMLLGPVLKRNSDHYPPADEDLGAEIDGLLWEDIETVLAKEGRDDGN